MLGSLFGHLDDRLTSICAGMAILSSTQAAICGNYDAATCGPVAAKSVPLFHQTRPFFFFLSAPFDHEQRVSVDLVSVV